MTIPSLSSSIAYCAGGCGTALPSQKKKGFAYGHKGGCSAPVRGAKPKAAAVPEPEPEEAADGVEDASESNVVINFSVRHLDNIWERFTPEEKGFAVLAGLDYRSIPGEVLELEQ